MSCPDRVNSYVNYWNGASYNSMIIWTEWFLSQLFLWRSKKQKPTSYLSNLERNMACVLNRSPCRLDYVHLSQGKVLFVETLYSQMTSRWYKMNSLMSWASFRLSQLISISADIRQDLLDYLSWYQTRFIDITLNFLYKDKFSYLVWSRCLYMTYIIS